MIHFLPKPSKACVLCTKLKLLSELFLYCFLTLALLTKLLCVCVCVKSLQTCPALCETMDYSLPGSSVQGILHAGIREWVAMPSSTVSSRSRDQTRSTLHLLHWRAGSLPLVLPGKPNQVIMSIFKILKSW